ncbi:lipid A biosynthesis lauroyl acyltransferase [Pseudomonas aeruginosa]|nr:lipid A biosynthesis lauroyl acyltransferase [Pseudomonas aeruginosa]
MPTTANAPRRNPTAAPRSGVGRFHVEHPCAGGPTHAPLPLAAALASLLTYNARSSRARSISWRNSKVPWWWVPCACSHCCPGALYRASGPGIGWLMWKLPNRSREVVRINLSKCFPELSEAELEKLVGQSLMDIGKTLTESACAWIWPPEKSLKYIREVEGMEVLEEALGVRRRPGRHHQSPGQLGSAQPLLLLLCQADHFLSSAEAEGGGRTVEEAARPAGQSGCTLDPGRHPQRDQGSEERRLRGDSRRPGTGAHCRSLRALPRHHGVDQQVRPAAAIAWQGARGVLPCGTPA